MNWNKLFATADELNRKDQVLVPGSDERDIFARFGSGYCSTQKFNCEECSLVNYGQDCHNRPL